MLGRQQERPPCSSNHVVNSSKNHAGIEFVALLWSGFQPSCLSSSAGLAQSDSCLIQNLSIQFIQIIQFCLLFILISPTSFRQRLYLISFELLERENNQLKTISASRIQAQVYEERIAILSFWKKRPLKWCVMNRMKVIELAVSMTISSPIKKWIEKPVQIPARPS